MAAPSPTSKPAENLEQARARIVELEKGLDAAISTILRRDDQLQATERRVRRLTEFIEDAGLTPPEC